MSDRAGKQIGNYRLIRPIDQDQGTYGEVWLAERRRDGMQVAIKLLKARFEGTAVTKFLNEARNHTFLRHRHIIEVLDFGVEEERGYLVMPYAVNGSLRALHAPGQQVPLETVANYVRQIAQALAYLYAAGVIHRDIKPENMLRGPNEAIWLSDFGIAVRIQSDGTYTSSPIAGTAIYIAPEQFKEQSHFASDQYSLAIVIYEWLAGHPPFKGDIRQLMYQHVNVPPPSLRDRVPSLPPAVERVIMRALEKDPHARYPSITAFAAAFEQAVMGILAQAEIIARLNSPREAAEALQDESLQRSLIHWMAQDEPWWRSEALPALQRVQAQAAHTPGSTVPASLSALAAAARQKLSEALLALETQSVVPLLGMLSLGAPPASAPRLWVELLHNLAPIHPPSLPWPIRSWLLQQWGRLTPVPEAERLRAWMEVPWNEVEQLARLKLPTAWYEITIEALLTQTFPGSLEVVERVETMFLAALSAMLQHDQRWGQARSFFSRLVNLGYHRKLQLLASLLATPMLTAQKADALWQAAMLDQQEREAFFQTAFPQAPLSPEVQAFLEDERRKLLPEPPASIPIDQLRPEAVYVSLTPPPSTVLPSPISLVQPDERTIKRRECLKRGNAYYEAQDYQRALECYEEAIRLEPIHANSYQSKGNALRELGRAREALAAYECAIVLNPKQGTYYTGKGWALVDLKNYEEALQAFDEALRRDSTLLFACIGQGTAYDGLQRPSQALEAFERAIKLDPTCSLAYRGKGRTLLALGRLAEAEQALAQARRLGDSW